VLSIAFWTPIFRPQSVICKKQKLFTVRFYLNWSGIYSFILMFERLTSMLYIFSMSRASFMLKLTITFPFYNFSFQITRDWVTGFWTAIQPTVTCWGLPWPSPTSRKRPSCSAWPWPRRGTSWISCRTGPPLYRITLTSSRCRLKRQSNFKMKVST